FDWPLGVAERAAIFARRNLLQPPMALADGIALDHHLLAEHQPAVSVDPADALGRGLLLLAEQLLQHALSLGRPGEEIYRVERLGRLGGYGGGQRQRKRTDAGQSHSPWAISITKR